jgi:cytochrome c oxidase cbb3-type subunit 3/ubiquinol-cytochrome c reductase cytochrome c subunit
MNRRLPFVLAIALALLAATGCQLRGKPGPGAEVPNPDTVLDSTVLYNQNCSGCHGADGQRGAAVGIGDPVYLALVSDDTMRSVASKGRPGTAMSAFAQKEGGMLTDAQVNAIVQGIRQRWSNPTVLAGATLPPYQATGMGDVQRGEAAYNTYCASCHGTGGKSGPKAGSVIDPAYLSLITDQGLRTMVITGRPAFNAPDWRNNVPGHPMSDQEITDVVAYLAAHRPAIANMPNASSTPSAAGLSGGSQ